MDGRDEGVSAGRWVSRVHGRVCPDLGLAGLAREASPVRRHLLLDLAFGWCCCADARKGGDRRKRGAWWTTPVTDVGGPPQATTQVNDAVDQTLGQTPWPDLSVFGVVPRDVDVLVLAWAAQVGELREDLGVVADQAGGLLQDASPTVPQAQLALVEDDLVHRGVRQHLWPGMLGVEPGRLGLLVDEVAAVL